MNRRQRQNHARLWPILLLLLMGVSGAALMVKAAFDRAGMDAAAERVE